VNGTEIWRNATGSTWNQVNVEGYGNSNNIDTWNEAVFNSHLFLGTRNDVGRMNSANGGEVRELLSKVYLPLIRR
jgi:hypothetical protein